MRVAIIGRTEILYETAKLLRKKGYEIVFFITSKEAPEYKKSSAEFKELADLWSVPYLYTSQISNALDFIKECGGADVAVSLNYSGVIPDIITELFPLGILNAHGGDLPRYRGNACQAWAILNGEERIGLCIHRMKGGELDSGDIIGRDYLSIELNTKITEVYQWLGKRIPYLFIEALEQLSKDPGYILERQSTDTQEALRCYPRRPEDGRIDWNKSAEEILRLINACNKPYAGAFSEFEGQNLIIWDAEVAPVENYLAIPGQVTEISDGYIDVATGCGKLRVKEVEYKEKVSSPNELVKSIRERLK